MIYFLVYFDVNKCIYIYERTCDDITFLVAQTNSALHPSGSVNEYQLRMGRQRQVWFIPSADKRVGVQVKL